MKQETAVTGGAKRRMGQAFVSPRKKLLAKVAAKQGDKAKKGLSKAKNPVDFLRLKYGCFSGVAWSYQSYDELLMTGLSM
ncbi:hypothetical protein Bca52824_087212 [Brassica carinata]|uniref:Uncharacterized protein n=1 Tax=Brassica carinata TaxID=52824 RepID=A0A8X7PD71_BRACI|nr:hypothetical protein Bca52824_087212 [Brassica carinata]